MKAVCKEMRSFLGLILLGWCSGAFALDNNQPETWPSPNRRYAVREAFCGEGKRVIGVFVHRITGRMVTIYPSSARSLRVLWSPDSQFVTLDANRSKYRDEARLYRVEHGHITEIGLPPALAATDYLSAHAKEHLGALSFDATRTVRWLNNTQVEFVSETEARMLDSTPAETVSEHLILEISHGEAKIVKQFREDRT